MSEAHISRPTASRKDVAKAPRKEVAALVRRPKSRGAEGRYRPCNLPFVMPTSPRKNPSDTSRSSHAGAKRSSRSTGRGSSSKATPRRAATARTPKATARTPKATARTPKRSTAPTRYWSQHVTETSDALDLDEGVFSLSSPKAIAASLKRSAERSRRRKSDPYRSAMSMLVFYVNRAGRHLSASRKEVLEKAKGELRALYGRGEGGRGSERRSGSSRTGSPRVRAKKGTRTGRA